METRTSRLRLTVSSVMQNSKLEVRRVSTGERSFLLQELLKWGKQSWDSSESCMMNQIQFSLRENFDSKMLFISITRHSHYLQSPVELRLTLGTVLSHRTLFHVRNQPQFDLGQDNSAP